MNSGGDKSDEADCEDNNKTTCALDEFRCADGKQCIKNDERCDMHINCNDKSDESDCDTYDRLKECHEHQFKCPGENHCLDLIQRCDGSTDCKNGFDELDCGKHRPDLCGDNMFACMNGQCIDKHWECDSYVDCEDRYKNV